MVGHKLVGGSARKAGTGQITAFLRDEEQGSTTIWNLFWLCGFGALLGLGVDTTAAMNAKAQLQTVADTAAHAAVMDLFPISDKAIDTALVYARENIAIGGVVDRGEIILGYWDPETLSFETEDVPHLNAVRVVAARDDKRGNALATSMLRLIGFDQWDISAVATATYFHDMSQVDRCRKEGIFAGGTVELSTKDHGPLLRAWREGLQDPAEQHGDLRRRAEHASHCRVGKQQRQEAERAARRLRHRLRRPFE